LDRYEKQEEERKSRFSFRNRLGENTQAVLVGLEIAYKRKKPQCFVSNVTIFFVQNIYELF